MDTIDEVMSTARMLQFNEILSRYCFLAAFVHFAIQGELDCGTRLFWIEPR